ncbi:hypothetical protein GCM10011584_16920 [Nocardioides phosphati]|uniref:CcoQ/FixQ family Cbb3-type cytochrome c oxidase assembly chaperone n=1 Tax=Nocardioides phosphati TaxID=1867775 RepID=A0ABQ2NA28_9ACTN|nr:hypothetical protein [Nocardioides phosphati]GGO88872.1 hypothetical protein GCM10011584_16920 [Nocardioides phosphati]
MQPFIEIFTRDQVLILIAILFFFLLSIVISLSARKDAEDGDLEHFDHEHGEADAR